MASRREFLQVGVAALALPISTRGVFSPALSGFEDPPASIPLYKVIFDQRFPASRAFAEEAARLGTPVHAIQGDITDLWFHDLYYRWKESPVAIAGLTEHGPIFCLERLAWDQKMRVAFRADHRYRLDRMIEHALSGPGTMSRQATDLKNDSADWRRSIANLVMRCPVHRAPSSQINIVASTVKHADDPEHLISWVIAPVNRT